MTTKDEVVLICGPTAAGKTELAVELAERFGAEVISADSRQFYRELNIGTAKPRAEELRGIPHYFIDSHSIEDHISAGDFAREASKVLEDILSRHKLPIVVGGSGLYIDALLEGLDDLPVDMELRKELNELFEEKGRQGLLSRLETEDPSALKMIDEKNPMRVIRALELVVLTGKKLEEIRLESKKKEAKYSIIGICLSPAREILYDRINERVDRMIEDGLVEEVRGLIPFKDKEAMQTVGYRELFPYFEEKTSLDEAIRLIKRNSRRYAKRQLTWFRKKEYLHWFNPEQKERMIRFLEEKGYAPK